MNKMFSFKIPIYVHTILVGVIGLFILSMFIWSITMEIEELVQGQGRVIPSGKNKVVQHLEGGIIENIYVDEGQFVQKGDKLYEIHNTRAEAELQEVEIEIQAKKAVQERLKAEINDEPFEPASDQTYHLRERKLMELRSQQLKDSLSVLQEQANQKKFKLKDLNSKVKNLKEEKKIVEAQLEIADRLTESGAYATSELLDVRGKNRKLVTQIESLEQQIPLVQAELQEMIQRQADKRSQFKADAQDDLNEVDKVLSQLYERKKVLEDKIYRKAVLAPVGGVINRVYVNTVSGVVKEGEKLAEITPSDDKLLVEAQIDVEDRGRIYNNQPVKITFTAYDFSTHGGAKGEVTQISADSFVDQAGTAFYRVTIEIDKDSVSDSLQILPGMTVEANIIAGERSVFSYILRPVLKLKNNAFRER